MGRGGGETHCILAARVRTREAAERIRAMKASNDVFFLTEKKTCSSGDRGTSPASVSPAYLPEFGWPTWCGTGTFYWPPAGGRKNCSVPALIWRRKSHGRNAGCPAPPVQIPACGTTALGS